MKKPLISVIIPAYNEEKYILFCLQSVVKQDFPKQFYELIVVDNNSNDKTRTVVRKNFPQVKIIEEKRQGVVFARIKGVQEAKGEIIVFIDADSLAPKNWLKTIFHAYRNPQVVAVGGTINFQPKTSLVKLNQVTSNYYYPFLKIMPGSNMSFRRKAYLLCGGFSPKINLGEEIYISQKLKKLGKIVMLKNNPVTTSSRRLLSLDSFLDGVKYTPNFLSIVLFEKSLFFHFKPIRGKGFLNKINN